MRQLSPLDAQFLAMENGRVHGHVSSLAVLDPSTAPGGRFDATVVRELVAERLHLLPPFRWRLVRVPFELDHPYWVEDPDFDLDYHVREIGLPPPGDDRALAEVAAEAASRPLDRARPLWEMLVVHGLSGGRVALLSKVHHAVVDGMSGAELLAVLLDVSPTGRDLPPAGPRLAEQLPSDLAMFARGVAGLPLHPLRGMRALPRVLPGLAHVAPLRPLPGVARVARLSAGVARKLGRSPVSADGGVLESPLVTAPRTRLNGPVSAHRRFAYLDLPLATVKAIKDRHAVTVNDVVMTVCASALRRRLAATGDLPTDPLVAMVPLSVRTPEQTGTFGNRISMMIVPIPTDIADPFGRLMQAHQTMRSAKEQHQALPATLLSDVAEFIPPALYARATRTLFSVAAQGALSPAVNVVISNVPGPPIPLYCGGARMLAYYPVSVLFEGVGLNITVMSYLGSIGVGLVADRDMMPDVWELAGDVRDALAELEALPAAEVPAGATAGAAAERLMRQG